MISAGQDPINLGKKQADTICGLKFKHMETTDPTTGDVTVSEYPQYANEQCGQTLTTEYDRIVGEIEALDEAVRPWVRRAFDDGFMIATAGKMYDQCKHDPALGININQPTYLDPSDPNFATGDDVYKLVTCSAEHVAGRKTTTFDNIDFRSTPQLMDHLLARAKLDFKPGADDIELPQILVDYKKKIEGLEGGLFANEVERLFREAMARVHPTQQVFAAPTVAQHIIDHVDPNFVQPYKAAVAANDQAAKKAAVDGIRNTFVFHVDTKPNNYKVYFTRQNPAALFPGHGPIVRKELLRLYGQAMGMLAVQGGNPSDPALPGMVEATAKKMAGGEDKNTLLKQLPRMKVTGVQVDANKKPINIAMALDPSVYEPPYLLVDGMMAQDNFVKKRAIKFVWTQAMQAIEALKINPDIMATLTSLQSQLQGMNAVEISKQVVTDVSPDGVVTLGTPPPQLYADEVIESARVKGYPPEFGAAAVTQQLTELYVQAARITRDAGKALKAVVGPAYNDYIAKSHGNNRDLGYRFLGMEVKSVDPNTGLAVLGLRPEYTQTITLHDGNDNGGSLVVAGILHSDEVNADGTPVVDLSYFQLGVGASGALAAPNGKKDEGKDTEGVDVSGDISVFAEVGEQKPAEGKGDYWHLRGIVSWMLLHQGELFPPLTHDAVNYYDTGSADVNMLSKAAGEFEYTFNENDKVIFRINADAGLVSDGLSNVSGVGAFRNPFTPGAPGAGSSRIAGGMAGLGLGFALDEKRQPGVEVSVRGGGGAGASVDSGGGKAEGANGGIGGQATVHIGRLADWDNSWDISIAGSHSVANDEQGSFPGTKKDDTASSVSVSTEAGIKLGDKEDAPTLNLGAGMERAWHHRTITGLEGANEDGLLTGEVDEDGNPVALPDVVMDRLDTNFGSDYWGLNLGASIMWPLAKLGEDTAIGPRIGFAWRSLETPRDFFSMDVTEDDPGCVDGPCQGITNTYLVDADSEIYDRASGQKVTGYNILSLSAGLLFQATKHTKIELGGAWINHSGQFDDAFSGDEFRFMLMVDFWPMLEKLGGGKAKGALK